MRVSEIAIAAVVLVLAMSLAPAFAAQGTGDDAVPATIETVVSYPKLYDGDSIVVEGVVTKVHHASSPRGDAYTLFRLSDRKGNRLGVYAKGFLALKKGIRLRVLGKFRKEKRYFLFRFKNVLKALVVEPLDMRLIGDVGGRTASGCVVLGLATRTKC